MKKIFLSLTFFIAIISQTSIPVLAQDTINPQRIATDTAKLMNQASSSSIMQQKLQNIIKKADTMVKERINTLNNISIRIQSDKRLTTDEKNTLNTDLLANITSLNALKTKIDSDTDVKTASDDTKQIVTNYRVYLVLEPKFRLLITLYNLQATVVNLQTFTPKLQTLINNLKSQGKDVSGLTPLLTNVNNQLQTINSSLDKNITAVKAITPSSSNPQTTFAQIRRDIKTNIIGRSNKIHSDINQMKVIFKKINAEKSPPATPSANSTSSGRLKR